MSYEVVNEKGALGQFASNAGYAELVRAAKGNAALELLFTDGESRDIGGIVAGLKALEVAGLKALERDGDSVAATARALADLIAGSSEILITDGLTRTEGVAKLGEGEYARQPWIGVDLDGTLAEHTTFEETKFNPGIIGAPVPRMVERVKAWLAAGKHVRIFTARVADDPDGKIRNAVEAWSKEHIGQALPVTNAKDPYMTEFWDDRAVAVERNKGVEKYSDDQPRDEHGRWAAGAGGESHAALTAQGYKHVTSNQQRGGEAEHHYERLAERGNKEHVTISTQLNRDDRYIHYSFPSGAVAGKGSVKELPGHLATFHGVGKSAYVEEWELVIKAGNGVMVGFFLPLETAESLAVENGEAPEEMHLTLAYLGKLEAIDLDKMGELEAAVESFASSHPPLHATLGGPMRFEATAHSEGRDVCVATVESDEIQEYRNDVVACIEACGLAVRKDFAYMPHITLAYIDPQAELPVQRIEPVYLTFDKICLCISEARKEYPFTGIGKFDSDQPRDEDGKWTGGGTEAGGSDTAQMPQVPGRTTQRLSFSQMHGMATRRGFKQITSASTTTGHFLYPSGTRTYEHPDTGHRLVVGRGLDPVHGPPENFYSLMDKTGAIVSSGPHVGLSRALRQFSIEKSDTDMGIEKFDPDQPRDEHVEKFELSGHVIKLDPARQLAFGWFSIVSVNGKPLTDTQDDVIDPAVLEDSAYDFVLNARKGGEMHEGNNGAVKGVGRLVESVVFTREKQEAMLKSLVEQGIQATLDLGCEAWWGGMKIDDPDTWKRITTGELRAWSIGGKGKREKLA